MTNEEYFATVNTVVDEIIATVSKQALQPKEGPRRDPRNTTRWSKDSGAVYMTSVRNHEIKAHREGVVMLMPYWQAASQIIGPTRQGPFFRVSTDSEIQIFLREEAEKRQMIQSGFSQRKGIAQFTVPPVYEEGAK